MTELAQLDLVLQRQPVDMPSGTPFRVVVTGVSNNAPGELKQDD